MQAPIQLSSHQLELLARGEVVRLESSPQDLVLVPAERYELLTKSASRADMDPKDLYPLLADVLPDDWEDLAAYPQAEAL